jgi:hypothetical protein
MAVSVFAQPKIAVYVAGGRDAGEYRVLSGLMLEAFVGSGKYVAIERSEAFIAEIDREQVVQRSGAVDDAQISRLGRQSGVDFVCVVDIEPAFGEYHLSARVIDVETARVTAMSTADSPLSNMGELRRAVDVIVDGLLGSGGQQRQSASRQQSAAAPRQQAPLPVRLQYDDFTGGQRIGTWALNWLFPGLGSFTIMDDKVGGWTQIGLFGGGIILMVAGIDEECTEIGWFDYCETVVNDAFFIGLLAIVGNGIYNIYRSVSYRPKPRTALGDMGGLNFAIMPDRHGELRVMARYNLSF